MALLNDQKKKKKEPEEKEKERLYHFGLVVCFLFAILAIRIIYLQAYSYSRYAAQIEDYTSIEEIKAAPRGQIRDCHGKILAKTSPTRDIVFAYDPEIDYGELTFLAKRFATVFDLSLETFSQSEQQQAWLDVVDTLEPEDPLYQGLYLLSGQELDQYENDGWSDPQKTLTTLLLTRLDEKELAKIDSDQLIEQMVYNRMMAFSNSGESAVVLKDVDDNEVGYLIEHKTEFPGFDADFSGWKREYPYGESLSDVLGAVSDQQSGLPQESAGYFLQRGFQYNSQVGLSGLEFQYNDILSGQNEVKKITYDSLGNRKETIVQPASMGHDLYLSIDIDLQKPLDDKLKEVLELYGGTGNREHFQSLFMCLSNPQSGALLALSGWQKDLESEKMTYFASGNYQSLINPGSVIKGATLFMGQQEGVIEAGDKIEDSPLIIGGREFGSYQNHGLLDDIGALSYSSNVYMFQIALRLAGLDYEPGMGLPIENSGEVLTKMREYYSLFGLGQETGLDIPDEAAGYLGTDTQPAMVLNFAIGQYDMYTPLQLLLYTSTIANGGKVFAPSLMSEVFEVNSSQVVLKHTPEQRYVFSESQKESLKRVQMGFQACVADGNCYVGMQEQPVNMAAKTGTAEVGEWTTSNFAGYGPVEDPQVAFACSAPTSSTNNQSLSNNICAAEIAPEIISKYFELYPSQYLKEEESQSEQNQEDSEEMQPEQKNQETEQPALTPPAQGVFG